MLLPAPSPMALSVCGGSPEHAGAGGSRHSEEGAGSLQRGSPWYVHWGLCPPSWQLTEPPA